MSRRLVTRIVSMVGGGVLLGGALLGVCGGPSGAVGVHVGPYGHAQKTENGNSVSASAYNGYASAYAGSGGQSTGNVAIAVAVNGVATASAGNG